MLLKNSGKYGNPSAHAAGPGGPQASLAKGTPVHVEEAGNPY